MIGQRRTHGWLTSETKATRASLLVSFTKAIILRDPSVSTSIANLLELSYYDCGLEFIFSRHVQHVLS